MRIISILQQVKLRDPEWKKFIVRYCHVTQWVLIVGSKYIQCLCQSLLDGGLSCQCLFDDVLITIDKTELV